MKSLKKALKIPNNIYFINKLVIVLGLIFVIYLSTHCVNNNKNNKADVESFKGNWYRIENRSYSEIYFTEDKMHVYNPYSGDVLTYNYYIKSDSVFRRYDYPNLINESFNFYQIIRTKRDNTILFKDYKLTKLDDKFSLEMYLKDKISFEEYDHQVHDRMEKKSK